MNRKSYLYVLSAISLFVFEPTHAQNVPESSVRKMNIAVLNTLYEYERVTSLTEDSDRDVFLQLFEDTYVPCIYNDLLGTMAFQRTVSAQEYVNSVPVNGNIMLSTLVSDVEKVGRPYYDGGRLHAKLALKKTVTLIDSGTYTDGAGGVMFDSQTLFGDDPDFRLVIDFVYDENAQKCMISSITATPKDPSVLDHSHFSVLVKSDSKNAKQLTYEGKPINYNSFDQAIVCDSGLGTDAVDVLIGKTVLAQNEHYDVISLNFKNIRGRMKIRGGYSPNAYSIKSTFKDLSCSSWAAESSFDLGVAVPASKVFRLGFYFGAGFSFGSISMSVKNINYSYTSISPVGSITRNYSFSATEGLQFMDVFMPLYMEGEFYAMKNFIISLDLGAKLYYNMKTIAKPYHVEGQLEPRGDISEFISPVNYGRKPFDVSLLGSLGLEYGFSPKSFIFVSAGYEYGLSNSYSGEKIYYKEGSGIYPFVYSAAAKKDLAYRSLVGTTTYRRQGVVISLGFKFKF